MSDPGIRRFEPSNFLACDRLILCVLLTELSDPGIKNVSTLYIFLLRLARLLCFQGENFKYEGCQNSREDFNLGAGFRAAGGGTPHLSYYRTVLLSATTQEGRGVRLLKSSFSSIQILGNKSFQLVFYPVEKYCS